MTAALLADLPVSATWPPSRAIAAAISGPMPRDAPVTRAVRPLPKTLEALIRLTPSEFLSLWTGQGCWATFWAHQVEIAELSRGRPVGCAASAPA